MQAEMARLRKVYPDRDAAYLRSKAKLLDEKGAIREIVAEASQMLFTRGSQFAQKLSEVCEKSLWEKIRDMVSRVVKKMQQVVRGVPKDGISEHLVNHLSALQESYDAMLADTLNKAGYVKSEEDSFFENAIERGNEKASAGAEVQMQIRHEDTFGFFYVEIDAKDIVGENISATDSIGKKARLFLRERFRGVVLPIGRTKGVYIRSEGINEYTNPAKYLDESDYNGKMLAATELDNLLKASEYLSWENDDGRHPDVIRWLKYKTIFLVTDENGNKQVLQGVVKIKRIRRGDCFYDITEIKNITAGNMGQAILANAAQSQGDVPNNSIPQNPDLSTENAKVSENSDDVQFQYRRVEEEDRQVLARAANRLLSL